MSEPERTAHEHHLAVRRTARYYTLGPDDARELWFVLHGYSQLAGRFIQRFQPIDDGTRLIVAPEALNRYYFETAPGVHPPDAPVGATWMTREDRLADIDDYVTYLDTLASRVLESRPSRPQRIVALGFSQGVATVARWVARGSTRVTHLVLWAGFLPNELVPAPALFHGAKLTWVVGRGDGVTSEERVVAASGALRAAGLAHAVQWHQGAHRIDEAGLRSLAHTVARDP